jgi:hypothetical protein
LEVVVRLEKCLFPKNVLCDFEQVLDLVIYCKYKFIVGKLITIEIPRRSNERKGTGKERN